jgi:U4/U6 small nuclear ribonucleoprotein PRP3
MAEDGADEVPLISEYIQHPIPIPPPWGDARLDTKVRLTKKEQKKLRRQRRMADLKDHQDRVRMGLAPPDPPKGWLLFLNIEWLPF